MSTFSRAAGEKDYTLDCGEGEALTPEGKDFFVAVEPATDANIGVTFYTDDKMATRTRNGAVTLAAKDLLPVEFNFKDTDWHIPVTSVSIDPSSTSIEVGDTLRLAATITPDNATNKNVTWSSSNAEIVSVDDTGKLTAIASGSATITVTTTDGNKTATCLVTVTVATKYTVTFDLNGITGTAPTAQTVDVNGKVIKPVDPTAPDGSIVTFAGWYKTKDETTGLLSDEWNFETNEVTADITLYAQWKTTISQIVGTNENVPELADFDWEDSGSAEIPEDAWVDGSGEKKAFWVPGEGGGFAMLYKEETEDGIVYYAFGPDDADTFFKVGDKYVCTNDYGTFTCTMTNGVFTSLTFVGASTFMDIFDGTYSATATTLPAGALSGGFTINAQGKKVHFSKGNLWYGKVGGATDATFQFEDKQYEFHGYDSVNNTWGFFGWVGASSTQFTSSPEIYGVSTDDTLSYYGSGNNEALKADWGKAIDNKATWRTLTIAEWQYLFAWNPELNGEGDFDSTSPRYNLFNCGVTVCGKENCVVLLPDAWKWEGTVGKGWQTVYPATSTDESPVTWEVMEKAGAVCLPAAGYRVSSAVIDDGPTGIYWSSSTDDGETAYNVLFTSSDVFPFMNIFYRYNGCSVRLVTDVPAE